MSSPLTFYATVSEQAMTKVSRLFNASLGDIFNELFQNARRAGANSIKVTQFDDPDFGPSIRVKDDGPGLANPETLFTLGQSSWDEQMCKAEDTAGMGFLCEASHKNPYAKCIIMLS